MSRLVVYEKKCVCVAVCEHAVAAAWYLLSLGFVTAETYYDVLRYYSLPFVPHVALGRSKAPDFYNEGPSPPPPPPKAPQTNTFLFFFTGSHKNGLHHFIHIH